MGDVTLRNPVDMMMPAPDLGASAQKLMPTGKNDLVSDPKIDKVATEFEAMVLGQMVGFMFEGREADPLLGGGYGEEMYKGLLISEYGKVMAQSGGVGIADAVKAQLIQLQEAKAHE